MIMGDVVAQFQGLASKQNVIVRNSNVVWK